MTVPIESGMYLTVFIMTNPSRKLGREGKLLNLIKGIQKIYIILNGDSFKTRKKSKMSVLNSSV